MGVPGVRTQCRAAAQQGRTARRTKGVGDEHLLTERRTGGDGHGRTGADGVRSGRRAPRAAGPTAGSGMDQTLLGKDTRTDGADRPVIAGQPAHRHTKDPEAGQADGRGVDGTWHAQAADGLKASPASPPGPATPSRRRAEGTVLVCRCAHRGTLTMPAHRRNPP